MTTDRIFLMGMPGSGKTTLGKGLAAYLDLPFIDLDVEIELDEGRTIPEIFEQYGEEYFRKLEAKVLRNLVANKDRFLMSLGGGTPCYMENLEVLKKEGKSIYMEVSAQELFKRLHGSGASKRPLLNGKSQDQLLKELEDKLNVRNSFYRQADLVAKGDNLSISEVLKLLND
ncbi:shikimate kinase [Aureibacter tunicatorum]|uniref:Shikimate kinase n=1 Tax=Aureibacter tunicatorum TaxID=866807 RepID=A0AAE3XHL3_9BACT|nr:shikimate kinase [Aureibacter tunicatorum]MDR6237846.1 shikimate kinase [Aureibacter tunicatorum]BDD02881.1 shikimate kinase [Aureibacter tunicatorum]